MREWEINLSGARTVAVYKRGVEVDVRMGQKKKAEKRREETHEWLHKSSVSIQMSSLFSVDLVKKH